MNSNSTSGETLALSSLPAVPYAEEIVPCINLEFLYLIISYFLKLLFFVHK